MDAFLFFMLMCLFLFLLYAIRIIYIERKTFKKFLERKKMVTVGSKWLDPLWVEDESNPFDIVPKHICEVLEIRENPEKKKYVRYRRGRVYKDGSEILDLIDETSSLDDFAMKFNVLYNGNI